MTTVVLIRPGCTDFDDQRRIQGTLDLPLNDRGHEQVERIVNSLEGFSIDAVYTGPCEPARATAETIGDKLGAPVKESEGLRNLDQGLWQGLPVDEVRRKYPKVFKQWHDSPETICPPEGETVPDAVARIQKALRKPLKRRSAIAVVASEPLATLICGVLKGIEPEIAAVGNGGESDPEIEVVNTDIGELQPQNGEKQVNGADVAPQGEKR